MPDAIAGTATDTSAGGPRRGGRGGPLSLVFVLSGAIGFSASLTAVHRGMRDLMINGGSCASGGPYAIQNQCTGGRITLLIGGIFAMLIFGGILAAASQRFGGASFLGAGLLMWAALFGALGFNFMQLGIDPPARMSGAAAWIVCGAFFWLMALGGLIPGLAELKEFVARGDAPEPSMFKPPLVRARVPVPPLVRAKVPVPPMPGFPGGMPGAVRSQTAPDATGSAPAPGPAETFIDPVTGEPSDGSS